MTGASLPRLPEPARGVGLQGASGLITDTSKSVATPEWRVPPVPFEVICHPQVTPVSVGNPGCTPESLGELLSMDASVPPTGALIKSGFQSSPADANVQPGLRPAELSNHPEPVCEQEDPGLWIGATLPNTGRPWGNVRASVTLSAQWVMTKITKPPQLKEFSSPKS